jgi:hypothetical protein
MVTGMGREYLRKSIEISVMTKRGRKSQGQREAEVVEALRHLNDVEWLDDCVLANHPFFDASGRRGRVLGRGLALRNALLDAIQLTVEALRDNQSYERVVTFLEGYKKGDPLSHIANRMGIRRENLFRTHRPKALSLVARNFLKLLRISEI